MTELATLTVTGMARYSRPRNTGPGEVGVYDFTATFEQRGGKVFYHLTDSDWKVNGTLKRSTTLPSTGNVRALVKSYTGAYTVGITSWSYSSPSDPRQS